MYGVAIEAVYVPNGPKFKQVHSDKPNLQFGHVRRFRARAEMSNGFARTVGHSVRAVRPLAISTFETFVPLTNELKYQ